MNPLGERKIWAITSTRYTIVYGTAKRISLGISWEGVSAWEREWICALEKDLVYRYPEMIIRVGIVI